MENIIKINPTIDSINKAVKNVQLYPSYSRIEPNDKASKTIFNIDATSYSQLLNGAIGYIVEKKGNDNKKEILTPFTLTSPFSDPLTEFDRAVLSVCISEYLAGNQYTTVAIIFRALIGKVGEKSICLRKNQRAAILKSISKLMKTFFACDLTSSFDALNYDFNDTPKKIDSAILPAFRAEVTINGQDADVIFFDRTSPFFDIANIKNQIVRYPAELLDVPDQNNTPLIMTIKNYIIRRISEIKLHKQLSPTVTFDDLFLKCRITGANSNKKFDVRNTSLKFFQHLLHKDFITSFETLKTGNSIYGISFQK